MARDRASWRWALAPLSVAILSRLYSIFVIYAVAQSGVRLPILSQDRSPLMAWDGQWYVDIARYGYHALAIQSGPNGGHHDFAFHPGWPILIQVASLFGRLSMDVVAVVLANVVFALAAIVIYRVFADRFSPGTALSAVALLAFNPAGYVFSMAYSEPLFLLMAGLYFANRSSRFAPLLAGASVLVRISGFAVAASALVSLARRRPAFEWRQPIAVALGVGIGFAAWWAFIWWLTGHFTGWLRGSPAWNTRSGPAAIMFALSQRPADEWARLVFLGLVIGGSLLLLRRHTDLAVYGLSAILLTVVGAPAGSMPRHAMIAFPAFAAIADRFGRRGSFILLVVFALGQIYFARSAFGPGRSPP